MNRILHLLEHLKTLYHRLWYQKVDAFLDADDAEEQHTKNATALDINV